MIEVGTSNLSSLTLNIIPISFSTDVLHIGHIPYKNRDDYRVLRETYWQTHVFRYDHRTEKIASCSLDPNVALLGEIEKASLNDHLLLTARVVQQHLVNWIAGRRTIVKAGKRLVFWGQNEQSRLLARVMKQNSLDPLNGIEVYYRYDIDCRKFWDNDQEPYLGLTISIDTANVIDCPVTDLIEYDVPLIGRYVCQRRDFNHPYLLPKLDIVGRIEQVRETTLRITGPNGTVDIDSEKVVLEPRHENLQAIITACCGDRAKQVLTELHHQRQILTGAAGQLKQIHHTLEGLQRQQFVITPDVAITFGDLLQEGNKCFPLEISTDRPPLLFGPQGRNVSLYPDNGIKRFGPYLSMQHTRNQPLVAVICESQYRGRVEQFLTLLTQGFPDEQWIDERKTNPFDSGIINKFRLSRFHIEIEECPDASPIAYRDAAQQILRRLPRLPDLAFVQTREIFKQLKGDENAYFVSKATFMGVGVPVQAVTIELIEEPGMKRAYVLNNIALATYAKLDGLPWVISTVGPMSHEIVIGIGSTEVVDQRWGERKRYVGLTTAFQGDGRYLVWELTREVTYEQYPQALLESLQSALSYVQQQNNWQPNEKVRLICHVYKRLKDREVETIKELVRQLVADRYQVEFAFLDISWAHPYRIFDLSQTGKNYYTRGQTFTKGKGVPSRGLCFQLDQYRVLLNLTGPNDVKSADQGLPQPLLIELHHDSDFTDLTYLVRQIFSFTYMSWRSFFPSTEPVTTLYSQQIARMLGNLHLVSKWDGTALTVGPLRGRRWFL